MMKKWKIYHLEREYAHSIGDPCLCTVWAENETEAIESAGRDFYFPTGALAVEVAGAIRDGKFSPDQFRPENREYI